MARRIDSVTVSAYISVVPLRWRAARPIVAQVASLENPSRAGTGVVLEPPVQQVVLGGDPHDEGSDLLGVHLAQPVEGLLDELLLNDDAGVGGGAQCLQAADRC